MSITAEFDRLIGLSNYQNEIRTVEPEGNSAILSWIDVADRGYRWAKVSAKTGHFFRGLNIRIDNQSARALWLETTLHGIARLLMLEANWDLGGAPEIDEAVIQEALDALLQFMAARTVSPHWTPTTSGGLQLDWHQNGIDLEICFEPGHIGYAMFSDNHGQEWDGPVSERLTELRLIAESRLNG